MWSENKEVAKQTVRCGSISRDGLSKQDLIFLSYFPRPDGFTSKFY